MYTVASAPAVRDRLGLNTHRFNFFLGGGDAVLSCLEVSRKKAVFDIIDTLGRPGFESRHRLANSYINFTKYFLTDETGNDVIVIVGGRLSAGMELFDPRAGRSRLISKTLYTKGFLFEKYRIFL